MLNEIVGLTKKLIAFESVKDNLKSLEEIIDLVKGALCEFTVEEFERNGRPSILVYKGDKPLRMFKLILNGHLDVVAGKKDQFTPVEKNGRLYGRGSNDMKAAAAVELIAFKSLADKVKYPLALQLVTDEEIGGFDGVKLQIENGVRSEFVISGEPTDFGINNEAKGIVWTKIKTTGSTGHGAYVWNGKNALWKLHAILSRFKFAYPVPQRAVWKTTVNLSKIETSNNTFNKIPDDASAWLDFRFIPQDGDGIIPSIKRIVGRDGNIEFIENEPAQFTDKNNRFVKKLKEAVKKVTGKSSKTIVKHGGSDIRHFNAVGCDGVTFGPVGEGLHSDNEWVDIKSLGQYYEILRSFLLSL